MMRPTISDPLSEVWKNRVSDFMRNRVSPSLARSIWVEFDSRTTGRGHGPGILDVIVGDQFQFQEVSRKNHRVEGRTGPSSIHSPHDQRARTFSYDCYG